MCPFGSTFGNSLARFSAICVIMASALLHNQLAEMSQFLPCHKEVMKVHLDNRLPLLRMRFFPPQAVCVLNYPVW